MIEASLDNNHVFALVPEQKGKTKIGTPFRKMLDQFSIKLAIFENVQRDANLQHFYCFKANVRRSLRHQSAFTELRHCSLMKARPN